ENIKAPSEIASREFGYFPFGGGMVRHLSFSEIGTLRALLVREAPAGVYCSNSLYQDPAAEMQKKGWIKAELIFDIDADPLKLPCKKRHDLWLCKDCGKKEFGLRPEICPACKGNRLLEFTWACEECIDGTKRETFKLLEFLEQDFGLPMAKISVYFSGNAGYHIQVGGSALDELDQHGRSEISDYVTAQGIMSNILVGSKLSPDEPGWRGRIARYLRDIPVDTPPFKTNEYDKRIFEIENKLKEDQISEIFASAVQSNMVRIDPMVTTDIHRIFRMPETLNNKTGLVKRQTKDLQPFDPLSEAVALPEERELISMSVDMCPRIVLGGMEFGPFIHVSEIKLPLFVGVYLICRGAGKAAPKTSEIPKNASTNSTDKIPAAH
ncbi:MAG: DNA primase small subunit domain-containing protein, partial [Nitrososphaerales archaeon]